MKKKEINEFLKIIIQKTILKQNIEPKNNA